MITSLWQFLAVKADTPSGFVWHWRVQRAAETLTSEPFAFYFECVVDARGKGYAGMLPAGPRVPLRGLPQEPGTGHETPAEPRATDEAAPPGVSIRRLSATQATRRRARAPVD